MTDQTKTFPTATTAAPKKRAWWKRPAVLIGAGAFILGSLIGGAGKAPAPEPVTIEKIVEKPVTKTITVEKTPATCLTALTLSEQAFDYAAEALGHSNEALQAAGRLDAAGIEAAGAKMRVLNPKIAAIAPEVNAAKSACRAAN